MKKAYIFTIALFYITRASACIPQEEDVPYPDTLYQFAQLSLYFNKKLSASKMTRPIQDGPTDRRSADLGLNFLKSLGQPADFETLVDKIFTTIPTTAERCQALLEPRGRQLIKKCCQIEYDAESENKIVLWRFSSPHHFPKDLCYSRGLFSGYVFDGCRFYAQPSQFPKGTTACTYMYFANCEFARRVLSRGMRKLYEEFQESFPGYCGAPQKESDVEALEQHFEDEPVFLNDMEMLLADLREIPQYFEQVSFNYWKFLQATFNCFKNCSPEARAAAKDGELYALIIPSERFEQIKRPHWGNPKNVVFESGEFFHPKFSQDFNQQLLADGCDKITVFQDGEFILFHLGRPLFCKNQHSCEIEAFSLFQEVSER